MNPSLPYVDLVFCLKCPILNLTQDLLETARFFLGISIYRKTVKRVNTVQHLQISGIGVGSAKNNVQ